MRELSTSDYWTSDAGILVRLDFLSHEVVYSAYNEACYGTMKELGVSEAEWVADYAQLNGPCNDCDRLSGRRFIIGQYMPKQPRHPECKCWWDFKFRAR